MSSHRSGPSPLPLHLAQAAALVQQAITCAPADPTAPDPALIAAAGAEQLAAMLKGIEIWRAHPYQREDGAAPVLWSDGSTRLLDFGEHGAPVVLVLPSLINRADILDLMPECSFLKQLADQGVRPLLLDWGIPGTAEQPFGLSDYADLRLRPALAIARVLNGGPIPVLGYCMGGAFAVAAATRLSHDICALVTMGTPWNCQNNIWVAQTAASVLSQNTALLRQGLRGITQTLGSVPHELLQAAFVSLDPGLALRKFSAFSTLDPESLEAKRFVAVEDWLNAPVNLPGPVAEALLIDWQLSNTLASAEWEVLGGPVDPTRITCPTLSICATDDRIAPSANAEALPKQISGAEVVRPQTGHVGMIIGRNSHRDVIRPIARFLHAHAT
ncbi:alpha/beta fold hydrolase [Pontivivens insulae]|uniref:alpha/beta fold hydrolase n=1 Tax=Pontivivens insulae TaxID=1639689 RepID=UPI0013C2AFDB|nr:alpha/beta fold hydrolase [Pontivivens insulae]